MADLAEITDVVSLYGPLSAAETTRVDGLLKLASALARNQVPGIDQAAAATDPETVALVIAEAVSRALRNPGGMRSVSRTTGPFSESISYSDAAAAGVFYTEQEIAMLGGASTASPARIGVLRLRSTW